MFKSYIKIAVRNFSRNRLTSFINVFGLGLSMSVGLGQVSAFKHQLSVFEHFLINYLSNN